MMMMMVIVMTVVVVEMPLHRAVQGAGMATGDYFVTVGPSIPQSIHCTGLFKGGCV